MHPVPGKALGPGGVDIARAQGLHDARPQRPQHQRHQADRDGERGQQQEGEMLADALAIARHRQDGDGDGEGVDEHDAEPVAGQADAEDRGEANRLVPDRVGLEGGQDGRGKGDQHGQHRGIADQEQGRREPSPGRDLPTSSLKK